MRSLRMDNVLLWPFVRLSERLLAEARVADPDRLRRVKSGSSQHSGLRNLSSKTMMWGP